MDSSFKSLPQESGLRRAARLQILPTAEAVLKTEFSTRQCGDVSDHFYETDTRSPPARFARRRKRELLLCRDDLNHPPTAVGGFLQSPSVVVAIGLVCFTSFASGWAITLQIAGC